MSEEEIGAVAFAHIELDPVISISIDEVIALRGPTPPAAILDGALRLPCPSGVIHRGRNGMRGRGDSEQVNDERFIPSDERMIDVKRVIGRPVPIKKIAAGLLPIPVPFDRSPQRGDGSANLLLGGSILREVLPGGEESLHQEGGFDQIAAVVIPAEVG